MTVTELLSAQNKLSEVGRAKWEASIFPGQPGANTHEECKRSAGGTANEPDSFGRTPRKMSAAAWPTLKHQDGPDKHAIPAKPPMMLLRMLATPTRLEPARHQHV